MEVRQLTEGCEVVQALLVRAAERCRRRDGRDLLALVLADRSGTVPAIVPADLAGAAELCRPGAVVHVRGQYVIHPRHGARLAVERLRAASEDEYEPADLHDGPARESAQMEADLRELLATVRDPYLAALLDEVFGEGSPVWSHFREAPAAKRYHQAYRHGLLEHSLGVAQAVSAISATFPGLDRDVAVTGALLHDIGKLEAYEVTPAGIEMSDEGRLYGEIPLGYYRVRRLIEGMEGFPEGLARAVLHIILSHHGSLEFGSPVVPCTREATLVHMIDNLGGRLGSFDRLEKQLPDGHEWSPYDKALGGGAFFPRATAETASTRAAA